MAKLKP